VRLHQGERATAKIYAEDPAAQARAFAAEGATALHVVDLDAAFGGARQLRTIERIAGCGIPVQVGGGIRDLATAQQTLAAGAARVIFGTAVVENPSLAGEAVKRFGAERVACGIDVKDGRAAVKGWTAQGSRTAAQLAEELANLEVGWLIITAVSRDGTGQGFDLPLLREVAQAAPQARLVASGGAGTLDHLRALKGLPGLAGAIAGTALYERAFTLREAQEALC
jgi:phosphoribosylformimino-5-aminoimidazole carboxamide ribotide isomerase